MRTSRTTATLTAGLTVGIATVGLTSLSAAPAMADSISDAYVEYWCDSSDDSTVYDVTLIADGVPGVSNSLNFVVDVDGETVEDVIVDPGERITIDAVDWRYADDPEGVLDVWVYYPPEEWFDGQDHWEPVGSWNLGFEQECAASGGRTTIPAPAPSAPAPSAPAPSAPAPSTPPTSAPPPAASGSSPSGGTTAKPPSGGGTSGKPSSGDGSGADSQEQASQDGSSDTAEAEETVPVADVEQSNSRRVLVAMVAALAALVVFGIGALVAKALSRD